MANTKSRAENTLLNSTAGIAAKVINIAAGLLMRAVFILTLGKEYLGVKSLFTSVLTMLSFAELGMSGAIAFAMYKPVSTADNRRVGALLNFYKTAYRIVSLTVLVLGLSLIPFMSIIVPPDKVSPDIYKDIVLIYTLYVVDAAISYLLIYKSMLFTAHQQQRYVSGVQSIFSLIRVTVECITLFLFKNFFVYLILGIIITRTQNWVVSRTADKRFPEIKQYMKERLPKEERSRLLGDIRAKMIYKISNALMRGSDNIIISAVFGSTWVAYVENYTAVTSRITKVVNQFYNSATPSIGNLAVMSDEEKQYKTFRTLQFIAFWVCCFTSVSFATMLNPFVSLWLGKDFVMPAYFVVVIVFQYYIGSMIYPVTSFRDSNGLFKQGRYRPAIMALLNIGLSLALALYFRNSSVLLGITGVKLATSVAQLLTLQWYDPMLIYRRVFKKKLSDYFRRWGGYFITAAVCTAGTWLLASLISFPNQYLNFALKGILCLIIPNSVIVLLYGKTDECKDFLLIMKRLVGKLTKKKKKAAVK